MKSRAILLALSAVAPAALAAEEQGTFTAAGRLVEFKVGIPLEFFLQFHAEPHSSYVVNASSSCWRGTPNPKTTTRLCRTNT